MLEKVYIVESIIKRKITAKGILFSIQDNSF